MRDCGRVHSCVTVCSLMRDCGHVHSCVTVCSLMRDCGRVHSCVTVCSLMRDCGRVPRSGEAAVVDRLADVEQAEGAALGAAHGV